MYKILAWKHKLREIEFREWVKFVIEKCSKRNNLSQTIGPKEFFFDKMCQFGIQFDCSLS